MATQGAMQVSAGGCAGFVEVCLMYPLDLVKTRLQLQNRNLAGTVPQVYYNGIFDCMTRTIKSEGFFGLYKGILPPLLVETPKRALKFLTFEQYKRFFMFGSETPTPLTYTLAGLGAGVTEGALVNPFEMVKVTLQANRASSKETPSAWLVCRQIVRESGVGLDGLNRGLTSTIVRNGAFNMVYFGFYHSVKNIVPECQDPAKEFGRKFAIGFVAGILGTFANAPFDVVKSRIQGPRIRDRPEGKVKYKTMGGTLKIIFKEEGFSALFKGLTPKLVRFGPSGAIMLVVYDYVYAFLAGEFQ